MAAVRGNPRLQVGSASWISEERASSMHIAEAEAEEFGFSARNEIEWLNEHMAEIFSKNQVNVAEIFKTPGKLRGKTPRTARKRIPLEARAPLSDVFSATPKGRPSPFRKVHVDKAVPTFHVAVDEPGPSDQQVVENALSIEDPFVQKPVKNFLDSGYYGSQFSNDATQPNDQATQSSTQVESSMDYIMEEVVPTEDATALRRVLEERRNTEESFQSAKEDQMRNVMEEPMPDAEPEALKQDARVELTSHPVLESPLQSRLLISPSPKQKSPERSAMVMETVGAMEVDEADPEPASVPVHFDDAQSPSDGSSPIRPIVRKSSLNFASLPAREPITTKKSIGNRVSRTSNLDQNRTSYYSRQTGGKSLENARQEYADEDMEVDTLDDGDSRMAQIHNKTSTQRLQDQISKLGQSQSTVRPASKSIMNGTAPISNLPNPPLPPQEARQEKSPQRQNRPMLAPGAFPEDEEDSWIGPPTAAPAGPSIFSPRPQMTKSHSTDVMEGIHGQDSIGGSQFNIPKRGDGQRQNSPVREPTVPDRTTSTLGHIKSVSTSVLRSPKKAGDSPSHKKGISVSNPNPSIGVDEEHSTPPPKSPTRSYRGSPLKAAKDKFSSILKTSRGLFASSAAVSAEAKTSTLSPASTRVGTNAGPSFEEVLQGQLLEREKLYPNLNNQSNDQLLNSAPKSPTRSVRKTRASTEREERKKEEEARHAKEAQRMEDQLEKARMKVKEDARVFHMEQERVTAMQKQVLARKEQEKLAKASQADIPRATRSSPRKTKAQLEAEGIAAAAQSTAEIAGKDVEMSEASQAMPPPALPRPKSQIGRPGPKRPLKPTKESVGKAKPPTVIRVDTGSQRGHQYHPSNSTLAATLQESLSGPGPASSSQGTLRSKVSTSSLQSKASTNSFKSAASKAIEAANKKRELDELAEKKKQDAKREMERKRALKDAQKEDERLQQEQARRREADRQREIQREREQATDTKKNASRQAIEKRKLEMERAKQMGAPPPAIRPQPSGDLSQDKPLPPVPAQCGDMGQPKLARMNSTAPRSQEDLGRSVNSVLHNTTKVPPKRPLQQESGDDHHSRPTLQRNGPSYQYNDAHTKRRKTSDAFEEDELTEAQPKMMAPPIRQSGIRQKDMPPKSLFPSGYTNAPPSASNLQRSAVMAQHNINQSKPTHPMDMAQVSKAPIAFASNSSQAAISQSHKTPARPAPNGAKSTAKSTAKSSPRYQNGETIDLPEIHTDSEDDDPDAGNDFAALGWTNSPDLRRQLVEQERIDPAAVFGQPGPLNMEEVFSKNKDRFGKFRARTSSANWSGPDRLTDDEVRKDLEARDRVRRQGGWTYDTMV